MSRGLKIGAFEEFDLGLLALDLHHARKKLPGTPIPETDENPNFREEMRTSLQLLKSLSSLPLQSVERELEEKETTSIVGRSEDSRALRNRPHHFRHLQELSDFRETLEKYKAICLSLIRLRYVSEQQFEAFSFLLRKEIQSFRRSRSRRYVLRRLQGQRFDFILSRHLLLDVESGGVREQLGHTFRRYLLLLSAIQYIQEEMNRSFQVEKLTLLLTHCYFACGKLIHWLRDSASYLENFRKDWAESARCTCAAVKLETRKIFEVEILELHQQQSRDALYIQFDKIMGLLRHTCQESFVGLASSLNPHFDEFELFNDLYRHYEDSNRLLSSLNNLHHLVREPAAISVDEKLKEVIDEIVEFKSTAMKFLFSRDWESFQHFEEELKNCSEEDGSLLLHRFEIYLSTLIGEVRKRSIFWKFRKNSGHRDAIGDRTDSAQATATAINW